MALVDKTRRLPAFGQSGWAVLATGALCAVACASATVAGRPAPVPAAPRDGGSQPAAGAVRLSFAYHLDAPAVPTLVAKVSARLEAFGIGGAGVSAREGRLGVRPEAWRARVPGSVDWEDVYFQGSKDALAHYVAGLVTSFAPELGSLSNLRLAVRVDVVALRAA